MINALIIFSREGFEAFLIVAIIMAYLKKTGRVQLTQAVVWGIVASVLISIGVAFGLSEIGIEPVYEGIVALVAAVSVIWLVIHMWRTAPRLKSQLETHLSETTTRKSGKSAWIGVFLFTIFMIAREGVESVLMLWQTRDGDYILGIVIGLLAAALLSWAWAHFGHRVNIRRFFQVTGVYLIMFSVLLLLTALHEFSEAHLLPNSEWVHEATEPYSPVGTYGKWFSLVMLGICTLWYITSIVIDRMRPPSIPATPR